MLKQNMSPFAMNKNIPVEPNNFRNCLEVVVVKWQICGLEIKDKHLKRNDKKKLMDEKNQHLKRSDKKSCWAKRINI